MAGAGGCGECVSTCVCTCAQDCGNEGAKYNADDWQRVGAGGSHLVVLSGTFSFTLTIL